MLYQLWHEVFKYNVYAVKGFQCRHVYACSRVRSAWQRSHFVPTHTFCAVVGPDATHINYTHSFVFDVGSWLHNPVEYHPGFQLQTNEAEVPKLWVMDMWPKSGSRLLIFSVSLNIFCMIYFYLKISMSWYIISDRTIRNMTLCVVVSEFALTLITIIILHFHSHTIYYCTLNNSFYNLSILVKRIRPRHERIT